MPPKLVPPTGAALTIRQYCELRQLQAGGIGSLLCPEAKGCVDALDPSAQEASPALDRLLLAAAQTQLDPLALLALRCRVSYPLEAWLRATHARFRSKHGLDLQAMASYALDDDGRQTLLRSDGASVPMVYTELVALPGDPISPFAAEVIRSYDPLRCSLPHWARLRIQAHNDLKRYFKEHGLLLISDWALLRHSSIRRAREACERFLQSDLALTAALDLHQRFGPAYDAAMADYRQRTGKGSGWQPDLPFLRALAPEREPFATKDLLLGIAAAIRTLQSGRWLEADLQREAGAEQLADPASLASEDSTWSDEELLGLIAAALDRALHPRVEQALAAEQPKWARAPDRLLAWKLYGEGLSQRAIAERCGHQQAWVSKLLQEKPLSTAIATAAAVELTRHPAFADVGRSVEGAERLLDALRNHLSTPEQEGDVAPLRQAVARSLATIDPQP
jgi:hypothetical protein